MGGEYLPGYRPDEVEIVRIERDSTTSDVISLRARPIGRTRPRIAYTLIDEYKTVYRIRPATARPLALGQLITLLDGVDKGVTDRESLRHGWVLSLNESGRLCDNVDPEPYRHFTRVSSEFYPELLKHYERLFDRWAQVYPYPSEQPTCGYFFRIGPSNEQLSSRTSDLASGCSNFRKSAMRRPSWTRRRS